MITTDTLGNVRLKAQQARRQASRARSIGYERGYETDAYHHAWDSLHAIRRELGRYLQQATPHSATERGLQLELGDCLAALGSLNRDAGRYKEAREYYFTGHRCELRVKELGGTSNSYCLVQEQVVQILELPWLLNDYRYRESLSPVIRKVIEQINDDRYRDPWAYADLALLTMLMEPRRATKYWDDLDSFRPLKLVYDSVYHVLRLLYDRLQGNLVQDEQKQWDLLMMRFDYPPRLVHF
ncbi:hypothetical protein SAMN05192549_11882 [Duganella sacchari]|uniref:Tetratricopeptide repeat-containing protein n=1 Tax=Duganella sacchari TaxID=551987 RepID=A0A1M7RC76_9BURK|nr:hypothetical protein [Duganella sacchari]SHN43811.1 hypothetical protein SAMN05192549_11882 [Duganella sacchari]